VSAATADRAAPPSGRIVVVTGAASGIGRATALALRRAGAVPVLVDRDGERLAAALAETRALAVPHPDLPAPEAHTADVSREDEVDTMTRGVLQRFGRIDALVHCAGILRSGRGAPRPLAQTTAEEWDRVLGVNLRGTFLCNRAAARAMMTRRCGSIINISSTSGLRGRPFDAAYCASKFAVIGLTRSLAEELRPYGVRASVLMPDAVDTPLWDQNGPIPKPEEALPPERIADLILYLLSLPEELRLDNLVVAPARTRRRRAEGWDKVGAPRGAAPGA
jgi:3-oxoacyl-[acyl-carrier protein] reductase